MSDKAPNIRGLGHLPVEDRERIVHAIHHEAQAEGWHVLSNAQKSRLYRVWEARFSLSHATVKDGIMKGFDAAQSIPASGEAAVHEALLAMLESSSIPFVRSKERRPEWRREVDFVFGFSSEFLTHIVELEAAPTWQMGLQQCLLYKSLYYQSTGIQILPTLILFGDVSKDRFSQIETVCVDQRVLLLAHELRIEGKRGGREIAELLQEQHFGRFLQARSS